jgi:hypothetical protein
MKAARFAPLAVFGLFLSTISCGGQDDEPKDDPDCEAAVEKLLDCGVGDEDVIYTCPNEGEASQEEICGYECVKVLSCQGLMSQTYIDCVGGCIEGP